MSSPRCFKAGAVAPLVVLIFGLLLVLPACTAGLGQALQTVAAPEEATGAPKPPLLIGNGSESRPVVLLGDSISTGYQTSVEESWPSILVRDLAQAGRPVSVLNAAQNGAGYLVPGEYGDTFEQQAVEAVRPGTSVVLVYGSENDIGQDFTGIPGQMTQIVQQVQIKAPTAQLVFIGPASYDPQPDPELLAIRDQIQEGADQLGARFVDPIAEGWIMGAKDQLIGPDGDHPSVQGHRYLAEKFEALLDPLLGYGQ